MTRCTASLLKAMLLCAALAGCSRNSPVADTESGSETTNGMVAGAVYRECGMSASHIIAALIPATYNPVDKTVLNRFATDTTGDSGRYAIHYTDTGAFNLVFTDAISGQVRLVKQVYCIGDTLSNAIDTLHDAAELLVLPPPGADTAQGYVYIAGTTINVQAVSSDGYYHLPVLPSNSQLTVVYAERGDSATSRLLDDSLTLSPGNDTTLRFETWAYSHTMHLNTTASGAALTAAVYNFPILLRLRAPDFPFNQARVDGADCRFIKENGSPLPYEIERWDSAGGRAEIWITMDTIRSGSSTQAIIMQWGNPQALAAHNAPAVFDSSSHSSFQGVWHMAGSGAVADATPNRYTGTAYGTAAVPGVEGIIGTARRFTESDSSHIRMIGTASGKLNFPESGTYTISAWVNPDTIDRKYRVIVAKGHEQYFVKLMGPSQVWEFTEWHDYVGDHMSRGGTTTAQTWTHIVGVRNGADQRLYVNGVLADSSISIAAFDMPRDTSKDVSIGRYLDFINNPPNNEGHAFFNGLIDEVQMSNTARSAEWIHLSYMNQKADNTLIVW